MSVFDLAENTISCLTCLSDKRYTCHYGKICNMVSYIPFVNIGSGNGNAILIKILISSRTKCIWQSRHQIVSCFFKDLSCLRKIIQRQRHILVQSRVCKRRAVFLSLICKWFRICHADPISPMYSWIWVPFSFEHISRVTLTINSTIWTFTLHFEISYYCEYLIICSGHYFHSTCLPQHHAFAWFNYPAFYAAEFADKW